MGVELAKDAIDIGIVVRDKDEALRFYRDTLGFTFLEESPSPTGAMQRLMCGNTQVKLVTRNEPPALSNPPGGPGGASGLRYWTIAVTNLEALTEEVRAAGYSIAVEPREIRPGVRIAMVEDPDGNWVEFLQSD